MTDMGRVESLVTPIVSEPFTTLTITESIHGTNSVSLVRYEMITLPTPIGNKEWESLRGQMTALVGDLNP